MITKLIQILRDFHGDYTKCECSFDEESCKTEKDTIGCFSYDYCLKHFEFIRSLNLILREIEKKELELPKLRS